VQRARAFAEPLLAGQRWTPARTRWAMPTAWRPSCGIGAAPTMQAAAYLVYAGDYLQRPEEVVAKAFGASYASLVTLTRKLVQIQRAAREHRWVPASAPLQTERVRKMLLAFSRDLRVVLLRLASRLQTLRWYAASKRALPAGAGAGVAAGLRAAGQPAGHLADQVGARGPGVPLPAARDYQRMARLLDEKRSEREDSVRGGARPLASRCCGGSAGRGAGPAQAPVQHLEEDAGQGAGLERVFDLRALRVIVDDVPACYAALARVHEPGEPVDR
jgi:GTP pyrophosphokinase